MPIALLVYGRGILHLRYFNRNHASVKVLNLPVGQPTVIGENTLMAPKSEPFEILVVDVPAEYSGKVIDLVTQKQR